MFAFRRLGIYEGFWLLVVVVLAMAARVWYLNDWADGGRSSGPLQVQGTPPPADLKAILANLTENRQFASRAPLASTEEQTAHVSPGYPWLMAWIDRMPASLGTLDRTMRWLQCLLGTLTALIYALLARRAFGSMAVAVGTGLLCAVHPFWVVNTAEINDGVVVSFLLGLSLWLGVRSAQDGGLISSFFFGVALACMGLTRAACLPFVFVTLLWFVGAAESCARLALCFFGDAGPFECVAALDLSQLSTFWRGRADRFVRSVSSLDGKQSSGDRRANGRKRRGRQPGGVEKHHQAGHRADERSFASEGSLRSIDGRCSGRGATPPRGNHPPPPARRHLFLVRRRLAKERQMLGNRVDERHGVAGIPGRKCHAYLERHALVHGDFWFAGLRWTSKFSLQAMPTSLAIIWFPVSYIVGHAAGLVGPRLPLDGVVLCYAAFALACIVAPYRSGLLRSARL